MDNELRKLNRRSLIRALPAMGVTPLIALADGPELQLRAPISSTLLRAAAGDMTRMPVARGGQAGMGWNAISLLHVQMKEEAGAYEMAAGQLRAAAGIVGLQTLDLGRVEDAYRHAGLVVGPDREILSRMVGPVAGADLSLVMTDGEAMSMVFGSALGTIARAQSHKWDDEAPSLRHFVPWDGNGSTAVAGGAVMAASGVGLINIGYAVGTGAGATFASSVVATAAVVTGVALLVVGVAVVVYAVHSSLGN